MRLGFIVLVPAGSSSSLHAAAGIHGALAVLVCHYYRLRHEVLEHCHNLKTQQAWGIGCRRVGDRGLDLPGPAGLRI